jgi:hypothetical protein
VMLLAPSQISKNCARASYKAQKPGVTGPEEAPAEPPKHQGQDGAAKKCVYLESLNTYFMADPCASEANRQGPVKKASRKVPDQCFLRSTHK